MRRSRAFATGESVIQSILLFVLGFLAAALLALVMAPALWQRAVRLTRQRVIASVPLSMNEIEAEKDRMRAAFAMEVRQIEMKLEASRGRVARLMTEISGLQRNTTPKDGTRDAQEQRVSTLESALAAAKANAAKLEAALKIANQAIERLEINAQRAAAETAELADLHEETALKLGAAQIELTNKEGEIAELQGQLRASRDSGKEIAGSSRNARSELKTAEASTRIAQRRAGELEKKYEKAMTRLADREVMIEGLRRDLSALRGAAKSNDGTRGATNVLNLDVARLSADNAALREQVLDLAARVVAMAAKEEGEGSPIDAALDKAGASGGASSLAERIKALQKSASAGRG